MNKEKTGWKVGLFVLVALVLAAGMVMRFSQGTGLASTYTLNLEANNAGGIIRGASVLMAGVPIGSISQIHLAQDGAKVTMVASIYEQFKISTNAVFGIGTVGFLGDRYISVSPGTNTGNNVRYLEAGETVRVAEAFDFSQVAESASGLMNRLSGTVDQLSNAVTRLDTTVISDQSLSNLTMTVANFRTLSERAMSAAGGLDDFVRTNTASLSQSITNFSTFTEKLNHVTLELQETVATNRVEFTATIKNIERATDRADKLLAEVEQGRGLAGTLLKNDELAQHSALMVSNFMAFGSNLNHKGLWGVFRKPKLPKEKD
jgi:phospholipid/cholesterol/gamma-HCH transport system substrate-binding protein